MFAQRERTFYANGKKLVGGEGIEPSRPFGQRILSPSCIPFHHLPEAFLPLFFPRKEMRSPTSRHPPGEWGEISGCGPMPCGAVMGPPFSSPERRQMFLPFGIEHLPRCGRKRCGPELNRCIAVLQTAALPLGYRTADFKGFFEIRPGIAWRTYSKPECRGYIH